MKRWLGVPGLVLATVLTQAPPAYADVDTAPIVKALRADHVYISTGLNIIKPPAEAKIKAKLKPKDEIYFAFVSDTHRKNDDSRKDFANQLSRGIGCACTLFVIFETDKNHFRASWFSPDYQDDNGFKDIETIVNNIYKKTTSLQDFTYQVIAAVRRFNQTHPLKPSRGNTTTESAKNWFKAYVIDKLGGNGAFIGICVLVLFAGIMYFGFVIPGIRADLRSKHSSPKQTSATGQRRRAAVPGRPQNAEESGNLRPEAFSARARVPIPQSPQINPAPRPISFGAQPKAILLPLQPHDPPQVGNFQILQRIGAGGMGEVFLGQDLLDLRSPKVAVKLIAPGLLDNPDIRRRFVRETEMAERFSDRSPHFARLITHNLNAEKPHLVSEFVDGQNLDDRVRANGPFNLAIATQILLEIAHAMSFIHSNGVIHRDIKPANLILTTNGLKVVDFGIAHISGRTRLSYNGRIGTPQYTSPEYLEQEELTYKSDIFAFGGVAKYLTTGQPAYPGNHAQVIKAICYGKPDLTGMPQALKELAAMCLNRDPAKRPTAANIISILAA